MDGFKNSTKTQYMKGGDNCYAKGGHVKGAAKIAKVMGEFKHGDLHSGSKSGPKVTSRKQATAIAMSEANRAPVMKKARGGSAEAGDVLISKMTKDELSQGAKGIRMAEERLAKRRVNLPKKAVPVAPREPMLSPRMQEVARTVAGLKKGGLAAMPKGKC